MLFRVMAGSLATAGVCLYLTSLSALSVAMSTEVSPSGPTGSTAAGVTASQANKNITEQIFHAQTGEVFNIFNKQRVIGKDAFRSHPNVSDTRLVVINSSIPHWHANNMSSFRSVTFVNVTIGELHSHGFRVHRGRSSRAAHSTVISFSNCTIGRMHPQAINCGFNSCIIRLEHSRIAHFSTQAVRLSEAEDFVMIKNTIEQLDTGAFSKVCSRRILVQNNTIVRPAVLSLHFSTSGCRNHYTECPPPKPYSKKINVNVHRNVVPCDRRLADWMGLVLTNHSGFSRAARYFYQLMRDTSQCAGRQPTATLLEYLQQTPADEPPPTSPPIPPPPPPPPPLWALVTLAAVSVAAIVLAAGWACQYRRRQTAEKHSEVEPPPQHPLYSQRKEDKKAAIVLDPIPPLSCSDSKTADASHDRLPDEAAWRPAEPHVADEHAAAVNDQYVGYFPAPPQPSYSQRLQHPKPIYGNKGYQPLHKTSFPVGSQPIYNNQQPDHPQPIYDNQQPDHPQPIYNNQQPDHPQPIYNNQQPEQPQPIYDNQQPDHPQPIYDNQQPDHPQLIYDNQQPEPPQPIYDNQQPDHSQPIYNNQDHVRADQYPVDPHHMYVNHSVINPQLVPADAPPPRAARRLR